MRVVFVNRYFHPDISATSQLLSDLTTHLAARGWEVVVITGRQLYDDPSARLPKREIWNGVEIRRVWTTRFGRDVLPLRALDYLTFLASAWREMAKERSAILVPLTDPPLLSVVAASTHPHVVNWIQDLFPDVARALGLRVPEIVDRLRDWSFARARLNVAIGELMAARIKENAVVRHNWADGSLAPLPRADTPFSVGYSGNLGRVHEYSTMLEAMKALPDVHFVVTGGGANFDALRAAAPSHVTFRPYAPRERLREALSAVDVHLVTLRPELEGLVVPSKFYGVLAVGRPVLYIGSRSGEVGRLIEATGCGVVVPNGDRDSLVRAIEALRSDAGKRQQMGRAARELYERRFSREAALAHWERILAGKSDGS